VGERTHLVHRVASDGEAGEEAREDGGARVGEPGVEADRKRSPRRRDDEAGADHPGRDSEREEREELRDHMPPPFEGRAGTRPTSTPTAPATMMPVAPMNGESSAAATNAAPATAAERSEWTDVPRSAATISGPAMSIGQSLGSTGSSAIPAVTPETHM